MNFSDVLKSGLIVVATVALAGCSSGNGGGGGGGAGGAVGGGGGAGGTLSFAYFQGEFDRVSNQAPTSDMPTMLRANYQGTMQADVADGNTVQEQIMADVDLDIDRTDGQMTDPSSGVPETFARRRTGAPRSRRSEAN